MLERILSLLDKTQNGEIARGEKSKFANALGLPHNVVAEWISGKNKSYKNHLYQIADKYNVSVEWLKGETDIKEKPPAEAGDFRTQAEEMIARMDHDQLLEFIAKATEKLREK